MGAVNGVKPRLYARMLASGLYPAMAVVVVLFRQSFM